MYVKQKIKLATRVQNVCVIAAAAADADNDYDDDDDDDDVQLRIVGRHLQKSRRASQLQGTSTSDVLVTDSIRCGTTALRKFRELIC